MLSGVEESFCFVCGCEDNVFNKGSFALKTKGFYVSYNNFFLCKKCFENQLLVGGVKL